MKKITLIVLFSIISIIAYSQDITFKAKQVIIGTPDYEKQTIIWGEKKDCNTIIEMNIEKRKFLVKDSIFNKRDYILCQEVPMLTDGKIVQGMETYTPFCGGSSTDCMAVRERLPYKIRFHTYEGIKQIYIYGRFQSWLYILYE